MSKPLKNHKRIYFLLVIIIMTLYPIHAQEFNAGIFGGMTASQVDGDSYGGFKKLGFTAGLFVNREIDNNIYWQLEIKYVTRGAYENFGPEDPRIAKSHYRYLELPLSVNYLFDEKVQVEIGLSPEVLLSYASFDEYGKIPPDRDFVENRPFGLSIFGGIHYWFKPSIGVGIRYTYSAIPFRDPKEWHNAMNRGYFHNVLCLNLAFKFNHL